MSFDDQYSSSGVDDYENRMNEYRSDYRPLGHESRVPGRGPFFLAGLIIAGGVLAFVYFLISGILSTGDSLIQVPAPGETVLDLAKPGSYTIFYEYKSQYKGKYYTGGTGLTGMNIKVLDQETGDEVPITPATVNSNYSIGSRAGYSIYDFNIARPGKYLIKSWYPDGEGGGEVMLAVGSGFVSGLLITIFTCIAVLGGSLGLGITIILITSKRRRMAQTIQTAAELDGRPY